MRRLIALAAVLCVTAIGFFTGARVVGAQGSAAAEQQRLQEVFAALGTGGSNRAVRVTGGGAPDGEGIIENAAAARSEFVLITNSEFKYTVVVPYSSIVSVTLRPGGQRNVITVR